MHLLCSSSQFKRGKNAPKFKTISNGFLCRYVSVLRLDTLPYFLVYTYSVGIVPSFLGEHHPSPREGDPYLSLHNSVHGQSFTHHCIYQSLNYSTWTIFPLHLHQICKRSKNLSGEAGFEVPVGIFVKNW